MKTIPLLLLLCTPSALIAQELEIRDATKDKRVTWKRTEREKDTKVDRVVVHATAAVSTPNGKKRRPVAEWFDSDALIETWSSYKRGPHFMIARDGSVTQFVPLDHIAMHTSMYNPRGIGVELVGLPDDPYTSQVSSEKLTEKQRAEMKPYTDEQYESLDALFAKLGKEYPGIRAIKSSDIVDRARGTEKVLQFFEEPGGKLRGDFPGGRLVRLLGRRVHEDEVWYIARNDGGDIKMRGWIKGSVIVRQARKFDPGSSFDSSKIKSLEFLGSDDF